MKMFSQIIQKEDDKPKKIKKLAERITFEAGFPEEEVYRAYIDPLVSLDDRKFTWKAVQPDLVRKFMQRKLGWDSNKTDRTLLPAISKESKTQTLINDFFSVA